MSLAAYMDADFINPFINSTLNALKMMAQVEPTTGKPYLKQNAVTWGVVTGLVGMAGDKATGNLVLSFDEPSILEIVSKMLMEEFKEIGPEVIDAVGELTNLVLGGAKPELSDKGLVFEMAQPIMITGQNVDVRQLSKRPLIGVPFKTSKGQFVLEASLEPLT